VVKENPNFIPTTYTNLKSKLFQNQIVILFDKKFEEMINVFGKSKFKLNPKNLSKSYFNVMPTIAMTSK
jgi:hypothetical protein